MDRTLTCGETLGAQVLLDLLQGEPMCVSEALEKDMLFEVRCAAWSRWRSALEERGRAGDARSSRLRDSMGLRESLASVFCAGGFATTECRLGISVQTCTSQAELPKSLAELPEQMTRA